MEGNTMKAETIVNFVGGRKNLIGYAFIGCTTFLVNAMIIGKNSPDYIGMATVIGAMATGVGALVWGNVKEHEANGKKEEVK